MSSALGYRSALESDFDFLYALHVATMKEYVDRTWGWDEAFQATFFRRSFDPDVVQILTFDGADIGMLVVEERPDDIFLRAIEIHPGYQGKGFGTAVINAVLDEGAQKMKPVRLHVLKVNPAKGLYHRLGFSVIEETPTHYIMLAPLARQGNHDDKT